MLQGSRISACIYLFAYLCVCSAQECKKVAHSVRRRTHIVLTISGHELLFIAPDFMVQNDYGF